ncbi:MAG: regulatory protein RecX [Cyanobacteriota bacterium]
MTQFKGQKELKPAEKIEDVMNYGLWHLGRRDHSIHELKVKLGRKTDNPDWIEESIEQMKTAGYLNDRKFVENFLEYCNEYKQYGPTRIKQELKLKGAENDIIKLVMEESEFDYFELALKCLNKKAREPVKDRKEKESLTRFLLSRGFSFDMIKYAFSEHLKEDE